MKSGRILLCGMVILVGLILIQCCCSHLIFLSYRKKYLFLTTFLTTASFHFIPSLLPSIFTLLKFQTLHNTNLEEEMGMAATESQQYHVLAVDDSIIDRKLIERLLKTSSYQVTTVDSGSKALEFLGLHENDETNLNTPCVSPKIHQDVEVNLVITDYCMPGMTGYDLLKKIKESSSLRNIPVVIMSSENVPSRITRCLEEGAKEFFLKPVRKSDLNRLEPHIKRTQLKDQKQETLEKVENSEVQQQQQPQQQIQNDQPQAPQQQIPQPESGTTIEQQQQSLQQGNTNKRKTMEQGLSPETDRTRPRYNSGIASVV